MTNIIWSLFVMLIMGGCLSTPSPPDGTVNVSDAHLTDSEEPLHTSPVFLPGTQPLDLDQFIAQPTTCEVCHGDYADYAPTDMWEGSMMSFAAMDPLFLALNSISNKDLEGVVEVGDFCLRCHTPDGWLAGRSEPVDGSAMTKEDFEAGVSCDFCHRLVDPLSDEGRTLSRPDTEAHANGQYVVSPDWEVRRGPYDDANAPHKTAFSELHTKSEICGTCHDIYNPVYDLNTPVETTYSEWKYSAFSREGIECQDCHMPSVRGMAAFSGTVKERNDIHEHTFIGASSWMPEVLIWMYDLDEERIEALNRSSRLAVELLQSAALLDLSTENGQLIIKVTNLAGHKLPTGYPEGRRMWLNVRFYDRDGNLISESGGYDDDKADLTHDDDLKVYEAKPGLKEVEGYPDGPSFHFALNNHIYKDNRIPPRGFTNADYERRMAYIRGAEYIDGQNWDVTKYDVPQDASKAVVRLRYQSTTKEFIEFLRDENVGNDWDYFNAGEKMYEAWNANGKAPPVDMVIEEIEF